MPLLGLGLYGGSRGKLWLKNRIAVFKQFVVPALLSQTEKNFTLWVSVRKQDREDPQIKELKAYLDLFGLDNVFTYTGLCFWDDKFEDKEAELRLAMSLHGAMQELVNHTDGAETIYMTIQPSDDCYSSDAVETIQRFFREFPDFQAMGFTKGYICDYTTKSLGEYNPKTNPPFYTIKFEKDVFLDSQRHMAYAPIKSHEYVGDHLKYAKCDVREFIVGCHGENVSTYFNHPYRGKDVSPEVFKEFGLENVPPIKINRGWKRTAFQKLPHKVQRKLRFWLGEKFYAKIYDMLIL